MKSTWEDAEGPALRTDEQPHEECVADQGRGS